MSCRHNGFKLGFIRRERIGSSSGHFLAMPNLVQRVRPGQYGIPRGPPLEVAPQRRAAPRIRPPLQEDPRTFIPLDQGSLEPRSVKRFTPAQWNYEADRRQKSLYGQNPAAYMQMHPVDLATLNGYNFM